MSQLALTGGTVVRSLDPPVVEVADVLIVDGRVATSETPSQEAVTRHDCTGCLIVPGNVCAHTHLHSTLSRGMPYRLEPPRTFVEILRRVWWRLDRALDPDLVRASALVGGMEALLAGTTTVVDHHASPRAVDGSLDIVADALAELGLRSVLCYETSDRDGPGVARAGLAENARFGASVGVGCRSLARALVGAHASFTLSPETLEACAALAVESGTGLHIHVAEDAADERDAMARFGMPVVERLVAAGALWPRTLLAHGVHLGRHETELVRASGATLVHNPRSNLNNGVGRAPLDALGARVALGTDGIGADMFEESRTGYFLRRAEAVRTTPEWALQRLARGAGVAAAAFGEPLLGRIEPGAPADVMVLDAALPTPVDAATLGAHWIFGLSSAAVRDVIVAGRLVVEDRQPVGVDPDEVAALGREAAGRLWQRLELIGEHPFTPGPPVLEAAGRGSSSNG